MKKISELTSGEKHFITKMRIVTTTFRSKAVVNLNKELSTFLSARFGEGLAED